MIHSSDFQLQTGERDHQEGAIHDGRMYRTLSGTYSFPYENFMLRKPKHILAFDYVNEIYSLKAPTSLYNFVVYQHLWSCSFF
jgi:hypothetical protein